MVVVFGSNIKFCVLSLSPFWLKIINDNNNNNNNNNNHNEMIMIIIFHIS